jgi:uncharacterized protein (TIGR03435 family)
MSFLRWSEFAGFGFLVAVTMAAAQATVTAGQAASTTEKAPRYEVASVKENTNPNPRWNMYFTADGVHAMDVTLLWALHEAYGIYDGELWSGGPTWLNQKRFDIEAKYDVTQYPNLTREQRMEMLQQLLADRFKLVVHKEPKEFPLYALVIAKDGPRMEETKPEDLQRSPMYGVMCVGGGRGATMNLKGCTMKQFANDLSGYGPTDLGRRVVDQTGLTGYYTLALHWAPINASNPSAADANAPDAAGPSIFTAVKEQLGLELKPTKGPIDTMVIDHAEMPTEN